MRAPPTRRSTRTHRRVHREIGPSRWATARRIGDAPRSAPAPSSVPRNAIVTTRPLSARDHHTPAPSASSPSAFGRGDRPDASLAPTGAGLDPPRGAVLHGDDVGSRNTTIDRGCSTNTGWAPAALDHHTWSCTTADRRAHCDRRCVGIAGSAASASAAARGRPAYRPTLDRGGGGRQVTVIRDSAGHRSIRAACPTRRCRR